MGALPSPRGCGAEGAPVALGPGGAGGGGPGVTSIRRRGASPGFQTASVPGAAKALAGSFRPAPEPSGKGAALLPPPSPPAVGLRFPPLQLGQLLWQPLLHSRNHLAGLISIGAVLNSSFKRACIVPDHFCCRDGW